MPLIDYIKQHYASQADFARANGVLPQQVTKWIRKDWIIVSGTLYSPVRQQIK